jgi:hypothetical protein
MAATFTKINKAEPVKLLDLSGVATKCTRGIINHGTSHFRNVYPVMFSKSAGCRVPHLNTKPKNLYDAIFTLEVIG